jgi:hypothetical protein
LQTGKRSALSKNLSELEGKPRPTYLKIQSLHNNSRILSIAILLFFWQFRFKFLDFNLTLIIAIEPS